MDTTPDKPPLSRYVAAYLPLDEESGPPRVFRPLATEQWALLYDAAMSPSSPFDEDEPEPDHIV